VSTFVTKDIPCPHCGAVHERTVAEGLHGPRVPGAVERILDGTFQRFRCADCDAFYVVDGPFLLMDFEQGFWFMCFPLAWENAWEDLVGKAETTFHDAVYRYAPPVAAKLGDGVLVRTVFGLDALREKLWCVREGLDDRLLEAWKLDLMRQRPDDHPFHAGFRPRITEMGLFGIAYQITAPNGTVSEWEALRGSYDRIARDAAQWADLVERLGQSSWVDIGRLMLTSQLHARDPQLSEPPAFVGHAEPQN